MIKKLNVELVKDGRYLKRNDIIFSKNNDTVGEIVSIRSGFLIKNKIITIKWLNGKYKNLQSVFNASDLVDIEKLE